MKKILLFALINLLFFTSLKSQKTYMPDDNFETRLIQLGYDSGPLDDSVFTGSIDTITNLNIYNFGISDLTGISDFIALKNINCGYNQLDSLDFSMNLALEEIACGGNNLKSIDVSMNTLLKTIYCQSNQIDSLDFSINTVLEKIVCRENNLRNINLFMNTSLQYLDCRENMLDSLNLANNTVLTFLNCSNNNLKSLNLSNDTLITNLDCSFNDLRSFNLINGRNTILTNIKANGNPSLDCIQVDDTVYSNTNWRSGGNFIFDSPLPMFNHSLCNLSFLGLTTYIPDVGFRRGLKKLGFQIIGDSILTSCIDTLTNLKVDGEKIKELTGIQDFTNLKVLKCSHNELHYLNLSSNTSLLQLWCLYNQLDSINVSNNVALQYLNCSYNNLTKLNVYSNIWLKILNCGSNQLSSLDITNNSLLESIICEENNLSSLDVSNNTLLTFFGCDENKLTNLDISRNTALVHLDCHGNIIKNILLPNTSTLQTVYCFDNELTSLDFSANSGLKGVYCQENNLRNLNLANGNNVNNFPNFVNASNNLNLFCIQVDSVNYSNIYWNRTAFGDTVIDYFSNYNTDCISCKANFGKNQPLIGQVTLTDSTYGNNLRYTWFFGDGDSSVSYLPIHNYTSAGTYNVCLTILDTIGGCFDTYCDSITVDTSGILRNSWTLKVIRNVVGVEEISNTTLEDLIVFPNPTTGLLNIEFDSEGYYSLFSIDGKKVKQSGRLQNQPTSIDISNLRTGLYILRVITDRGNVITKRIIKQ